MKRIAFLLLILVIMLSISGCGSADSFEKQKLCEGVWVMETQDNSPNGIIYRYYVFDFSEDGTFVHTSHTFLRVHSQFSFDGTYRIDVKNKQIIITYATYAANGEETGSKTEMIPYYTNEYTHNLIIFPNDNGDSKFMNYRSLSFVTVPGYGILSEFAEQRLIDQSTYKSSACPSIACSILCGMIVLRSIGVDIEK